MLIILPIFLPSCSSSLKNTRLHRSIITNDNEAAKKAALSTKNIDEYDKFGRTALHLAVLKNNKELTKFLITKGADINRKTIYGNTPLSLSMRHDDLVITKIFMEAGAEINIENASSPPLIEAVKFNRIHITKKLMENGAELDAPDKNNATALYYAASLGLKDILQELIIRGADINTKTNHNMSPIHVAAFNEKKEIVRALMSKGAKIYQIENNEKGHYSTAMLYMYAAKIYESNNQLEEALSAYKKAQKHNKLIADLFRNREKELKWDEIKKGLSFLGTAFIIPPIGWIAYPFLMTNGDTTKLNFYSEDTYHLVSGYSALNKTHPEYFEIEKEEPSTNSVVPSGDDSGAETNNPYNDLPIIKRQIYKGLSDKCTIQAKQCSSKVDYISNNSKKESVTDNNEQLPRLVDLEAIVDNEGIVNLYIYRKYKFVGNAAILYFFIDNNYYNELKCQEFIVTKIKPGEHRIKVAYNLMDGISIDRFQEKTIHLEKNCKDKYIELIFNKKNMIRLVSKEVAEKEMNTMPLTEAMQKRIFE
jgi:ankyrin repeat protein